MRGRRGFTAVLAAAGLVAFFILASLLIIAMWNRAAITVKEYAKHQEAPRTPEAIAAYLYNVSLCELMNRTIEEADPKLIVLNTGSTASVIDSIVVHLHGAKVYEDHGEHELLPGDYVVVRVPENWLSGRVYVHTKRGGLFEGGYGIPNPYAVVELNPARRCSEP